MDHQEFTKAMKTAEDTVDKERAFQILRDSMGKVKNNDDGTVNLIIVMEELAELQQQLSKYIRGKEDFTGLVEELGDVMLGIYYVQEICGISDELLHKAMNIKLNRQEKRNEVNREKEEEERTW